jgi:hypothetical protein
MRLCHGANPRSFSRQDEFDNVAGAKGIISGLFDEIHPTVVEDEITVLFLRRLQSVEKRLTVEKPFHTQKSMIIPTFDRYSEFRQETRTGTVYPNAALAWELLNGNSSDVRQTCIVTRRNATIGPKADPGVPAILLDVIYAQLLLKTSPGMESKSRPDEGRWLVPHEEIGAIVEVHKATIRQIRSQEVRDLEYDVITSISDRCNGGCPVSPKQVRASVLDLFVTRHPGVLARL